MQHRRQRSNLPVGSVVGHQIGDIHIAHAVVVGHQEGLMAHIGLNALDATAGHGVQAGIHHRDLPGFQVGGVNGHCAITMREIKGHIAVVQEVVGKPFLDDMLLVARTDDELIVTVIGVFLHDVPENRLTADLDHGLGLECGFFRKAGAETAG